MRKLKQDEVGLFFVFRFSFFDIRTEAEYRILTFKILFRHSHWGLISYFDIRKPISTFELRPNVVFFFFFFFFVFLFFDIQTEAEYRILTLKILFRHSHCGRISYFDIRKPNSTFELRPNIVFWHSKSYLDIRTEAQYRILIFELRLNIVFWHSQAYSDNWTRSEYGILTILF